MGRTFKTKRGKPILGATVGTLGTNFGIFSRNATKVILELYKEFYDSEPSIKLELDPVLHKTGDIWHIYVYEVGNSDFYGWRMDGPYVPEEGHRFNINKLLIDPYCKALTAMYDFNDESIYSYDKQTAENFENIDMSFSQLCSSKLTPKSIIIDESKYDWGMDIHPRVELKDTIIYEMHVRLFTMNPNSRADNRGTFAALVQKLDHLKELGITAIELLPIFEFNIDSVTNINPLTGKKLEDVWGYNPIGFFAVTGNYTYGLRLGEQVFQFKDFVKEVHKRGMEVILDVVYNHTGEGNEHGPTLSYKGIDNSVYYVLEKNKRYYSNYSGTGNTLNCSHYVVKEMIIESLRYWVTEMHVDGFRFDLAAILGRDSTGKWIGDISLLKDIADDPVLSGSKLIAEGWDAAGGYYVGEFPVGWAEWNGKYRDTIRRFVKSDENTVADLATRIVGSPDLFGKYGRRPYHSINFITAHDGFTLWDLVSYNKKHNESNGEDNKDGMNENDSYNCGIEGETDDIDIINFRKRQVKNFAALLMISQGVPMMLMGDEFCRTQMGNNNAYCQDNEISWVDWNRKEEFSDVFRFFKKMIEFRKSHPSLRREHFFVGKEFSADGKCDIEWNGVEIGNPDWSAWSHTLAFMIKGEDIIDENSIGDNDIYVILNSYWEDLEFEIPVVKNKKWYKVVDTYRESPYDFLDEPEILKQKKLKVNSRSTVILITK